jgi:uncharacterized protein (DUF1501 family)
MKRRDFIKNMSLLGASQFVLNSVPFKLLASETALLQMAANCPNDRVLIILQLHGGNDGLNMLIPTFDYDLYQNRRPNIAISDTGNRKFIPLDGTLANERQVGLHPDMVGIKQLYDEGKVAMVQGVSYENHNQSHFRGRDILFMGGGANDYLNSGWVGRYLQQDIAPKVYPEDFPNVDMKDPLALEFGNEVSLIFHQGENIPTSISITNPQDFFNLVETLPGFEDVNGLDPRGTPPAGINNSPYGKELNWILNLEQKTDEYDNRLLDVYNAGKAMDPNVAYPATYPYNAPERFRNNTLSGQLQIIANLIHGGSKTKVYMVRIGGFDTHAQQVVSGDASMGSHAALLYHISSAMKSFQDDLKARSIDDRVLSVTTSEFGRRVHSNGSYGTDHGLGAPLLLFGKHVQPGVNGVNPNLNDDNVAMQYDYRQVYATVMKEWMCVDPAVVDGISGVFRGDYAGKGTILPLINNNVTSASQFIKDRFKLNNCYPNPASSSTTFSFYINAQTDVELKIADLNGKEVKMVLNKTMPMGEHKIAVDLRNLLPGSYIYHIKTTLMSDSNKLLIVR